MQTIHIIITIGFRQNRWREFYLLYTRTAILRAELSKALEMVDSAMRLPSVRKDLFYRSECSFLKGT